MGRRVEETLPTADPAVVPACPLAMGEEWQSLAVMGDKNTAAELARAALKLTLLVGFAPLQETNSAVYRRPESLATMNSLDVVLAFLPAAGSSVWDRLGLQLLCLELRERA